MKNEKKPQEAIQTEANYFKNMDALIGMANIPTGVVDLVLTDPPYGIADKSKLTKSGNKIVSNEQAWGNDFQDKWESVEDYYDWLKQFIGEFVRVLNDEGSMILFLDRKYTGLFVDRLEKDFNLRFRNKVYFVKTNPVPGIRKVNYRSAVEEAIWLTKGSKYTFNFGEQRDMTQVYEGSIGRKVTKHPTEKNSWMVNPLIKNHTNKGDLVLDPFAGSGSTLAAALASGRNVIGFEKNPGFYGMARSRSEINKLSF
jgi:DNA modification methylase